MPFPSPTHALSPSFLRICKPQSHVFRYLCASRPCRTPATGLNSQSLSQDPFPVPFPVLPPPASGS